MISMQDIRAGNRVLHKASSSEVTIIKVENDKVMLDTFPESSYWNTSDVSGIPLNTSMLQQLSFTNNERYDTWRGQGIGIDLKSDGIFYGLRISKNRAKIQYLHQLQNYITDYYTVFWQQERSLNLDVLY